MRYHLFQKLKEFTFCYICCDICYVYVSIRNIRRDLFRILLPTISFSMTISITITAEIKRTIFLDVIMTTTKEAVGGMFIIVIIITAIMIVVPTR